MQCYQCGATIKPDEAHQRLVNSVRTPKRRAKVRIVEVNLCAKCAKRHDSVLGTFAFPFLVVLGMIVVWAILMHLF